MNPAILFVLFTLIIACQQAEPTRKKPHFISRIGILDCDTTITYIANFNDYLLCGQVDGTMLVLDSSYNRRKDLERLFKKINITSLFAHNDTVFFGNVDAMYFLANRFQIKKYEKKELLPYNVLYEDSVYRINALCAGRHGGSIFFLNKKTNQTFSFPATCAAQVLHSRMGYFVSYNTSHLAYNTGYFSIEDPMQLYELKKDHQKQSCNWWLDSTSGYPEKNDDHYVKKYRGIPSTMTLLNFYKDDSIYAVVSGDTGTYVTVLRDSAFIIKDTISKTKLDFHQTRVIADAYKSVGLLRLTYGRPFEENEILGSGSSLIVVKGSNIDLLIGKQTLLTRF